MKSNLISMIILKKGVYLTVTADRKWRNLWDLPLPIWSSAIVQMSSHQAEKSWLNIQLVPVLLGSGSICLKVELEPGKKSRSEFDMKGQAVIW